MKFTVKLSDRVLLIFIVFASILILLVKIVSDITIQQILVLSGTVYTLSFLTTFLISHRYSKKIINLAFKVEEMAAGNLSNKLKPTGKDEVGQLINSINELMTRLQTGVAIDVSKHREIDQAKTDFVTLASHQLRTPLSIIKWYVDFVLSGDAGKLSPEQEKYLKEVYKSNERLIELVNALLDVSRIDLGTFAIEPEPTDIVKIARAALKRFEAEIDFKHLRIEKYFDHFPLINLDPRLTKIVFENLVSNAVKYTPEGEVVRFEIKRTEKDAFIKIMDSGCGIPREQQPKIFTKLFRADNVKKIESSGTGLGLYIVKAVIEKSGGKIWFESPCLDLLLKEKGKQSDVPLDKRHRGTAFYITIPLKGMKKRAGTKKLSS